MPFTNGNDTNILQASDNVYVGAGAGDDRYIVGALSAGQSISISDNQGANKLTLLGGVTIASSLVTSNAILLTLSSGGKITVLGADTFTYELGGTFDPITNGPTGHVSKVFSDFVTTTLGVASVPASGAAPVSGANSGAVSSGGTIGTAAPTITLPVGATAAGTTTPVLATAGADVFTLNVAAAKASAPNTQDSITGFNVAADSLQLSGTGIAPGHYNLASVLAGISVQVDGIANQTLINFGADANGDLITLALVGVTNPGLVNVTLVGAATITPPSSTIALPVGATAAGAITQVLATAGADAFTLNVGAAIAPAPSFAAAANARSLAGTGAAPVQYTLDGLNVAAANASIPKTQDAISGFSVAADSLQLTGTGIAPGQYTLASVLAGITVSVDATNNQTLVNFGADANGNAVTVALVGVSGATNLVHVSVAS
jgi:hypothetical protein